MTPTRRVAVVTGASRGLGREIAVALAERGAAVAAVARSETGLAETVRLLREAGGDGLAVSADIADPEEVDRVKTEVERALGPPSILVNSAGVFGPIQLVRDTEPRLWIETLMVNTVGPYLTCRAFVGGMMEQGWGRIVNISSAASLHPPGPLNSAYATSKVALNQLTRHLAAELVGTGVTANVIHPGDVKTEMWAYIRDAVAELGPGAEAFQRWATWVEETGGDPPEKAVRLVLRIVEDDLGPVNGRFLWIDDPLQPPIPSWSQEPAGEEPWRD